MGLQIEVATAAEPAGRRPAAQKKIIALVAEPAIRLTYFPEAKDLSSKIVFVQVMRELRDGNLAFPSQISADFAYQDIDTTFTEFMHVDYVTGETDPYYTGEDAGDKIAAVEARHGNAISTPHVSAHMRDAPNITVPDGMNEIRWEFRTAAFSAAGADAGSFYRFVDWTYVHKKGQPSRLKVVGQGADPGRPFKDALNLWCFNHGFVLPTPPPPATTLDDKYLVKPGDYLSKIAKELYGDATQWKKIYAVNRQVIGPNPDKIFPGQRLVIPA
jgi:hypothetical protein